MSKRNKIGTLFVSVVALSMSACSTSYDCPSADVVDSLVQEAASSGFIPHMREVPDDWATRLASHTKARNIVTLDEDQGIQHFRCKANLEYREGARTVTSKDITYEVRKIEGEDNFSLEWEVPNDGIGDIDPIKMFAMNVQGPWRGELEKQMETEVRGQSAAKEEEARAWARGFAPEFAAKNPPLPFVRDALKKHADDFLASRNVEPVMDQFHDIDGDGFQDYFAIVAKSQYHEGEYAEESDNREYMYTGGFMQKNYSYVAVTQPFRGFGLETSMTLDEGAITNARGEQVREKYLPKEIADVASPPENPIVGVSNTDGQIVVSLADGQSVIIDKFKPEQTLEQIQQERLQGLENRLTQLRERGGDISSLYE